MSLRVIPIPLISFALEGGGEPYKAVARVGDQQTSQPFYVPFHVPRRVLILGAPKLGKVGRHIQRCQVRGTRMGIPLGLTNRSISSTSSGSGMGGRVTMVVPSNSTSSLCSVSLRSSLPSRGKPLILPCWVFPFGLPNKGLLILSSLLPFAIFSQG